MRKQSNVMSVLAFFIAFIAMGLFFAGMTRTVDAAPPDTVPLPDSMVETVFDNLSWLLEDKAPVAKTGQTTSYATGDDGDLEMGVDWPEPRFTDNGNGTVTDYLTGLIWLKNANFFFFSRDWEEACELCNMLEADGEVLTDGSSAGDWRLPNVRELHSLIDYGQFFPALPAGHPFSNVQSVYYWSSTTLAYGPGHAWRVGLGDGSVSIYDKVINFNYVWCVRGGE